MDPARALPIRATALAALLAAYLATAGCAAPTSYMGIALAPGAAEPELQALAQRAMTGDKHAQLALGIRFEEGNGVRRDTKRARKLYRQAATATGGTMYVYVPGVGKGGKGHLAPVTVAPKPADGPIANSRTDRRFSPHTTTGVRHRLEDLINCITKQSACPADDSIESFYDATSKQDHDNLRRRIVSFLANGRNRLAILHVQMLAGKTFDVDVEYTLHRSPTCLPSTEDDVGAIECFEYESLSTSRERWRVEMVSKTKLQIMIGGHSKVSMVRSHRLKG